MEEKVNILKCKRCGGKGYAYHKTDDLRKPYFIKCECGQKSQSYLHVDMAIADWNKANKPTKMKPKYVCACCGAEIHFGFDTCTKCGTEIEW